MNPERIKRQDVQEKVLTPESTTEVAMNSPQTEIGIRDSAETSEKFTGFRSGQSYTLVDTDIIATLAQRGQTDLLRSFTYQPNVVLIPGLVQEELLSLSKEKAAVEFAKSLPPWIARITALKDDFNRRLENWHPVPGDRMAPAVLTDERADEANSEFSPLAIVNAREQIQ
jgi:hypothetical protein